MNIKVKEYGRTELAMLLYTNRSPQAAWKLLRHRIEQNEELCQQLSRTYYDARRQRTFTEAQVRIILKTLLG